MTLAAIAFNLLCFLSHPAFSESCNPSWTTGQAAQLEEAITAGNKAISEGDWAKAESHFREAMTLEPTQGLWRIQLVLVLGQQKKWKEAFAEFEKVMQHGDVSWVLGINKKLPDGTVAFVNTEIFRDEQKGISRYVKAVKEKKKVESIAADIGKKLDAYAKQHKIALLYDISSFKNMRFESGNTADVTSDFIAYYNGLK
jgi:tetratricopeptide (TPR) repeat protein